MDIFIYTLGDPIINHLIAQEISCENNGEWFPVGDPSQIQLDIINYYRFYSAAIQDSDVVVWTDYYTDVLTGRSLIAACLPVYDPQRIGEAPTLIGVTCVAVDPGHFQTLTNGDQVHLRTYYMHTISIEKGIPCWYSTYMYNILNTFLSASGTGVTCLC